uniref:Uncharacterized protein n=1 Tax=Fagus sylvatica TaxID=28930 RepID=A0A2N9F4V0_FAGSY
MPLTKHLNVAIIDSNPALGSRLCFNKEDPPNPRVSTVTPASISLFKVPMSSSNRTSSSCDNKIF